MTTFTEDETTDLARIFKTDESTMALHLHYYEQIITDSGKAAILADVVLYQAIQDDNVFIEAGPAGFKGRVSPDTKRTLIKNRIAGLIGFGVSTGSSSGLVRS